MLIDTHSHVQFNTYKDDLDEVIKRSLDKGTIFNLVGTEKETSKKAVEVAEKYDGLYATIGLHPEHLFSTHPDETDRLADLSSETSAKEDKKEFDYEFYKKLALNPKVIAIGECGLDLYRISEDQKFETVLAKQKEIFLEQIKLAKELSVPLVIHGRGAHEEMIATLTEAKDQNLRGVMHCYSGSWGYAERYLALGMYLGFTGIITFPPKKANPVEQEQLLEVVKKMPENRILIETDCPYLAPVPYRGKRGEPWMVEEVAKKIAEIRKISVEEVAEITTKNTLNLFTKMKQNVHDDAKNPQSV